MDAKDVSNVAVFETPVMRKIAEMLPKLPPALRLVGDYVLRHPLRAATMNIDDLAQASGASPAAVNRLSRAIDCGGFIGLRAALVATLQDLVSPVDKLKAELALRPPGAYRMAEMLQAGIDNLQLVINANTEAAFEAAVNAIGGARHVYVLGFGFSSYLAGALASGLMPFCGAATAVSMEGGNEQAAYRMTMIGKEDVLVSIALPRYSLDTPRLSRFARERGATVVAITDSPASPMHGVAHHLLYTPGEHALLTCSTISTMAIIECLISAVMARNKEAVSISSELTENVLSYLYMS